MARRLSTGIAGRNVLGSIVAVNNSLRSVVDNANVILEPNGNGIAVSTTNFQINSGNSLRLADNDSSNHISIKAPATVAANYTLTLPVNDGEPGEGLLTDGNGVLSWGPAGVTITNQLADAATYYPTLLTATSGNATSINTSSTKLSFQPSTGTLTCTALSAGAITETSSITLKENIAPIENALDSILKLTGVIYDRKDGSSKNEAGLIAEQVNEVLPNLVTKDKAGNPYGINYTKFSAYLIEAVKDLSDQINNLKQDKYS